MHRSTSHSAQRAHRRLLHALSVACIPLLAMVAPVACDAGSGGAGVSSGTVTFGAEEGVDFITGRVASPGHFGNSDLYATRSGTGLKLTTGGPNPTVNRPINWFLGPGGVHLTFASLDEVPEEPPDEGMTAALIRARPGNAFVVLTSGGTWVRGWLADADGEAVTIVFARMSGD